jgi:hypothetical protein
MGYYGGQGDFYRGVGDPGLFSFLGKAASTAFHFLAPAPIKAAVSAATGIIGHARGKALAARESAAQRGLTTGLVRKQWGPGVGIMAPGGGGLARKTRGFVTPSHPRATGRPGEVQLFGPRIGGRRRHMNVANIKALRRAIRRMVGFQKVALGVFALLRGVALPTHHKKAKCSRCGRARCICRKALPPGGRGDFYMGDG